MGYTKDIFVLAIITLAIVGFLMFYSGNKTSYHIFSVPTKKVSCYEKYSDEVDNLSYYFSGINYTKSLAICIKDGDYSYCLGGYNEKYETNGVIYYLVYFKSCYLQSSFYPKSYDTIVEIDKEYAKLLLQNSSKIDFVRYLEEGIRSGKVLGVDRELLNAIKEYYRK